MFLGSSLRSGVGGAISSRNETKETFSGHKYRKMRTNRIGIDNYSPVKSNLYTFSSAWFCSKKVIM